MSALAAAVEDTNNSITYSSGTKSQPQAVVRVGVGCLITSNDQPGCILMGKRIGNHGGGKYAAPGGHLELGETWQQCAHRETQEETNLNLPEESFRLVHVTNDANMNGDPNKHYITIFMNAVIPSDSQRVQEIINCESHKCEGWEWIPWTQVVQWAATVPDKLFEPMIHLASELDVESCKQLNLV